MIELIIKSIGRYACMRGSYRSECHEGGKVRRGDGRERKFALGGVDVGSGLEGGEDDVGCVEEMGPPDTEVVWERVAADDAEGTEKDPEATEEEAGADTEMEFAPGTSEPGLKAVTKTWKLRKKWGR